MCQNEIFLVRQPSYHSRALLHKRPFVKGSAHVNRLHPHRDRDAGMIPCCLADWTEEAIPQPLNSSEIESRDINEILIFYLFLNISKPDE